MAHPVYLREKARSLRTERRLSIDEIAERLALPKTTIYYWVCDLPPQRARRSNSRPASGAAGRKWRLLREEAYEDGRRTFTELASDPTFRDFVCLYIAEGYKPDRNTVALCNSDPAVVRLANRWICRLTPNLVGYWVQYHPDQDVTALMNF
jgi:hypothetical protein